MLPKGDTFRVSFTYGDRESSRDGREQAGFERSSTRAPRPDEFAVNRPRSFLETQLAQARQRPGGAGSEEGRLPDPPRGRVADRARRPTCRCLPARKRRSRRCPSRSTGTATAATCWSGRSPSCRPRRRRGPRGRRARHPRIPMPLPGSRRPSSCRWRARACDSSQLRYTPDHPDVQRAKRIVADLEVKAQQEALQKPLSPDGPRRAPRRAGGGAAGAPARPSPRDGGHRPGDRQQAGGREDPAGEDGRLPAPRRGDPGARVGADEPDARLRHDPASTTQNLLAKQEDSKVAANLETPADRRAVPDAGPGARCRRRPISPNRPLIDLVGALAGLGHRPRLRRAARVPRQQLPDRRRGRARAGAAGGGHDPADVEQGGATRRAGAAGAWRGHGRRALAAPSPPVFFLLR